MRAIRTAAILPILCLLAALAPGNAAAQPITVGSEMARPQTMTVDFLAEDVTLANAQPVGPFVRVVSPVDGTVVRWRLAPQSAVGQEYRLAVLRPDGNGGYTAVATSDPRTASSSVIETFTTALPIKEGDLVGLDVAAASGQNEVKVEAASVSSVIQYYWAPFLAVGSLARPPSRLGGFEFEFNAEVQPAPEVGFVTPDNGPLGGGTTVTIKGQNFAAVSGVSFGSVAATSFTVRNEGEIVAVSPPGVGAGVVDITVTGSAGTSRAGSADRFTYVAPAPPGSGQSTANPPAAGPPATNSPVAVCKVPRLSGKALPAARKILKRSGCRLGAVRGHRRTGNKVARQSPRPGVTRRAGWDVNVTIG